MPLTNGGMSFVVVTRSMLTAKMTRPSFSKFLFKISIDGISSRHGLHHVAQKLRKTTFPRKSVRRQGLLFRSESEKSGAGLPTASGSYLALWSHTRVKTAMRMAVPTPRINRRDLPCAGTVTGIVCSVMKILRYCLVGCSLLHPPDLAIALQSTSRDAPINILHPPRRAETRRWP